MSHSYVSLSGLDDENQGGSNRHAQLAEERASKSVPLLFFSILSSVLITIGVLLSVKSHVDRLVLTVNYLHMPNLERCSPQAVPGMYFNSELL